MEGWFQGRRGGFRIGGVDSETGGVDSGTEGWIQGRWGGFRDGGMDSGTEGWIQFEFRWTPMSSHPNCKKHSKKVPRLTQNTTCPHGYLRRGLTRPNDISEEYISVFTTCYHVSRTMKGCLKGQRGGIRGEGVDSGTEGWIQGRRVIAALV
jgi:hypothetical protein